MMSKCSVVVLMSVCVDLPSSKIAVKMSDLKFLYVLTAVNVGFTRIFYSDPVKS